MNKKALITGITGQDGSYLAELLTSKGYEVHGIVRRHSSNDNQFERIDHIRDKLNLEYGDLLDYSQMASLISKYQFDEIYNLAAQSHVHVSSTLPIYTTNVNALGPLNILEAIRNYSPHTRFYQASTSEMFGNNVSHLNVQNENTRMDPVSPYGCAKLYAYNITRHYRNAYNLFTANGILFNHESPRRGTNFVTNKIVKGAVEISLGLRDHIELGNLDAARDWGHARDFVEAMWMMLQIEKPDDFVCATGKVHTVREFVGFVFERLGLDFEKHVKINPKYMRKEELKYLRGSAIKLRLATGWKPETSFEDMIDEMIAYWLEKLKSV